MDSSLEYSAIKDDLATGDIILFHGPSAESEIIEKIDHSPFSHVGIIVRLEGTEHNRPLLWESSEITELTDFETGGKRSGVHLVDLEKVLQHCLNHPSKSGKKYTFAWRKLDAGQTENLKKNFENFMSQVDGRAFPSLAQMAEHFLEGRMEIKSNMRTYFCSELASDTYMNLNLISKEHPPNYYSPGSFSEEHFELEMLNGAQLDPEKYFVLK